MTTVKLSDQPDSNLDLHFLCRQTIDAIQARDPDVYSLLEQIYQNFKKQHNDSIASIEELIKSRKVTTIPSEEKKEITAKAFEECQRILKEKNLR